MNTLSNQIKQMRKARKMTQSDLADQVGVHKSTISRLEKDEGPGYNVNIGILQKIAKLLDATLRIEP